ncbi:hypothetical protein PICMEDRAFT_74830 [Pichia membranifaciens NRRL Y-2026]|uniref:Uncharacterized protein n=1 Tax=Pichia membranifaciens NRRL Y-2026 TaxID=763406 RepID=A0A1E3NDM8_9ASCO|nr:hypothetical protein PICMEDRAFT_74830 [Pichia membranifaciens NRRL Y-2026]ODQ44222.1 hypothetical protein PICMEDRAFT_74830 [Pichia membranifaciens NRRL Y-2026]
MCAGNNITYDHLFIEYINDPNHENIGDTNDYGQLFSSIKYINDPNHENY